MPRVEIDGALALVTGAGGGIGRATATALAGRGARVLCTGRDLESAETTARLCWDVGRREAASYRLDVTDRAGMQALAARIATEHGPVDIVVNNAGVGLISRFTDISAEDWEWIRGVNLDGVVNGCAVFAPGILARGRGHLVNVSSGLAYMYPGTCAAYVATKAAVLALSRSLRADLGPHGIGVTAVCPAVTNTAIVDRTRYLGDRADPRIRTRSKDLFRYLPVHAHQALVARLPLT